MAKKFYAVKKGAVPGIYTSWDECKKQVEGYPGAIYKGFALKEDAEAFLKEKSAKTLSDNIPTAYVDGSYNDATKEYSYGVVLLFNQQEIYLSGKDNIPEMANMRNVAGEIMGSMAAMRYAADHNLGEILIKHDYQGISSWCLGDWKCKNQYTAAYNSFYHDAMDKVKIHFDKVQGHSGVFYNDVADALARQELGLPIKDTINEYLTATQEVGIER